MQKLHPADRRPAERLEVQRRRHPGARVLAPVREGLSACLTATSTVASPWYVVPADDKNNTHLIVSQIEFATLEALNLHHPIASPARMRELKAIRDELTP